MVLEDLFSSLLLYRYDVVGSCIFRRVFLHVAEPCLCCGVCSLTHVCGWAKSLLSCVCSETMSYCYPIPRDLKHLQSLRLRYFSPREVSLLLGFPRDLEFPGELTPRQMYALLGNSLSVTVVAQLLAHLLRGAGLDVAPPQQGP